MWSKFYTFCIDNSFLYMLRNLLCVLPIKKLTLIFKLWNDTFTPWSWRKITLILWDSWCDEEIEAGSRALCLVPGIPGGVYSLLSVSRNKSFSSCMENTKLLRKRQLLIRSRWIICLSWAAFSIPGIWKEKIMSFRK